jgi:hypothetical protein
MMMARDQRKGVAVMEWLGTQARWISGWIEAILWAATWLAILAGLAYEGGRRAMARATGMLSGLLARTTGRSRGRLLRVPVAVIAVALALASPAVAGQGWWWGSPITPGFDRNTVIRVAGTASRVDIVSRGGPSTLRLDTADESFTVMLAPGWYLAELRADIRSGDPLIVEGSKMMDRRQQVYLVAARITNQRTGAVLELRDEAGRPRWMGGPRPGPMVR